MIQQNNKAVVCSGITKTGKRCSKKTYNLDGYCFHHQKNENKVPIGTNPNKLIPIVFKKGECLVCLEEVESIELKCLTSHLVCKKCLGNCGKMKCPYCRREIQKNELPLDVLNKMKDIEKLEKDIKKYDEDLYHMDNQIEDAEMKIDSWIKHLEKCNNLKEEFLKEKKKIEKKLEDLRNK